MEIKDIIIWLLIFIIGSLIVSFLINPESFDSFKSNVGDIGSEIGDVPSTTSSNSQKTITQESLISKCKKSLNECIYTTETKYNADINLIKVGEFEKREDALNFFTTWKGMFQFTGISEDQEYPIVLMATTIEGEGGKMPVVIICNKEGFLINGGELLCSSYTPPKETSNNKVDIKIETTEIKEEKVDEPVVEEIPPEPTLEEFCSLEFSKAGIFDITSTQRFETYDSASNWIETKYPNEGLTINKARFFKEWYLDKAQFSIYIIEGSKRIDSSITETGEYVCDSTGILEK